VIAEPPATSTVDYTNDKLMWDGGESISVALSLALMNRVVERRGWDRDGVWRENLE
jgi:hypothetical protein